ncbi:MAG: shikimate dehydrogenase [Marinifilaceae bacterium]|nr:shikimate dehydrogenase [Marinifilaceae bacterium]
MKKYGIIGNPLGHSFSKQYFENKFKQLNIEAEFINFELSNINNITEILNKHKDLKGLCVTIPYKEQIIKYLERISPDAKDIAAVNSIKLEYIDSKLSMTGYNTDYLGFSDSLTDFIGNSKIESALILGTGGASKAVAHSLKKLNINYQFVSRRKSNTLHYDDLTEEIITRNKLIINTTPLGTFPNCNNAPKIKYEYLTKNHFIFDLVYNPSETLFLRKSREQLAKTKNGLEMLHNQAEYSWEIWNI